MCLSLNHTKQQKQNKMKATVKRFTTTAIKNYRLSNTTYSVSFDTIEEAKSHVESERKLHSRSKKFNPIVHDTVEKKYIRF